MGTKVITDEKRERIIRFAKVVNFIDELVAIIEDKHAEELPVFGHKYKLNEAEKTVESLLFFMADSLKGISDELTHISTRNKDVSPKVMTEIIRIQLGEHFKEIF